MGTYCAKEGTADKSVANIVSPSTRSCSFECLRENKRMRIHTHAHPRERAILINVIYDVLVNIA